MNLVSRWEGLCGMLDETVLMSADFVQGGRIDVESCGSHRVKGMDTPIEVFRPPV